MAALKTYDIEQANGPIPTKVCKVLEEFKDIIAPKLLKKLAPKREVDCAIKLILGAKPPSQAPYRISPQNLQKCEDN